MRVLDVGCGTGAITRDIAAIVSPGEVVGADLNDALLIEARARADELPNLRFEQCDIYKLPWTDEFDLVTAARVLQWLSDPLAALGQMRKCLKPSGIVVVLDYNHEKAEWRPSIPDSMSNLYHAFLRWREDAGMNNAIADELTNLLLQAGFGNVAVEVSDEISYRGEPDFSDRVSIWTKVADTRGHQLVRDGYVSEEARSTASREYQAWLDAHAEYHKLYLRTAVGRR